MTDFDSRRMLDWIDSALELFRNNEGQLNAREVRIQSLLSVARSELAEETERRARASRSPLSES